MTDSQNQESTSVTPPGGEQIERKMAVRRAFYCLVALALVYTLYFARTLLMPIVVAVLFALLLSPLVSLFKRARIPRPVSALLLIAMLGGPLVLISVQLAEPAQKWIAKVPELSAELSRGINELGEKLSREPSEATAEAPVEEKGFSFFGWFKGDEATPEETPADAKKDSKLVEEVKKGGIGILISMLGAAPFVVAQLAIGLILVLFLLNFGPGLYQTFVDISPLITNKRRATVVVGRVRQDLSRYILTVTAINVALGVVTAFLLWFLGVEDALLWGALVGLLNYAPYVGPLVAVVVLSIAGLAQYGYALSSLVPAAVYFAINLVESQFVTPTILGQQMRLNPLILVLWLLLWGWLWGPVGVLLAVPLLVCLKLVAKELNLVPHWVELIESQA